MFRPAFDLANTSQIEAAKSIAVNDLAVRGENVTQYQFKVSDKIREIPGDAEHKKVIEVTLYNESVHNLYIIDVQSGTILMHSRTEFYDGLNHGLDNSGDAPIGMRPERIGGLFHR
jgi:exonuclease III